MSTSLGRTFLDDDRDSLKELFVPFFKDKKYLTGHKVDVVVKRELPEMFKRYGSVKIRNKYREFKARFVKLGRI